jgi:hypothetical protein
LDERGDPPRQKSIVRMEERLSMMPQTINEQASSTYTSIFKPKPIKPNLTPIKAQKPPKNKK